jgi:hypothetical protein
VGSHAHRFRYAKLAVELDRSNGYASQSLGDVITSKKERQQAFYQAFKIAQDTNNKSLKIKALDGLSNRS